MADRRAGSPAVPLRVGPVRGRTASRDRCGRRGRRVGARACGGHRVVRRIRSRGGPCADDPDGRRLLRDPAAARLDRRAARGGGRRGSARGRGRRELRCGHARAARAPGRSAHRRRGGLPRPARVLARAPEGCAAGARARPRRGTASGAAAARVARAARRPACGATACGDCSATNAAGRRRSADLERGARRRRGGTGRRARRAGGHLFGEADRCRRADRARRSTAWARRGGRDDGARVRTGGRQPGARGASGRRRRPLKARRNGPGCAQHRRRRAATPA